MSWRPRVAILGAGGMGALFGSILQQGGLSVILIDSNREHVAAVRAKGLHIEGYGGERTLTIPITADAAEVDAAELILFQCKAHGSRAGARAVKHLTDAGALAVSLQNGLGNEQVIAAEVGADKVLGGLTTMAGQLLAPGRIRDFSRTPSYIGELGGGLSERAERIAAALTAAGLETHACADIEAMIWRKLLGNIALSALSGATDLSSAELLRIPQLKAVSLQALDEALTVAASQGIALDRAEVLHGLEQISTPGGTGDNKSSLCVDLLNRRPTEVGVIYDSVIAKGRAAGVATPTLNTLAAVVKGIESHYL